jgi:large subunit ribosomal protein L18Ae
MYKEFRDLTINGAIGQLYMELSGKHRVRRKDVAIIRTTIITKKVNVRRKATSQFFNNEVKYP